MCLYGLDNKQQHMMITLPFLLHLVPALGPVPWCSWPLRIDMFSSLNPSTCILGLRSLKSCKHMTSIHPWSHQLHQFPSSQSASDTSVCGNSVTLVLMLVLCFLWLFDGLHDASSMCYMILLPPPLLLIHSTAPIFFSSLKYTRCPLYVLSNSSVLALRVFSSSRRAPSPLFSFMSLWPT